QGTSLLQSPALSGQLRGNVFVWDRLEHFSWQQEGDTITVGDGELHLSYVMHFSRHPWQWLLVVTLFLLALAWVTHALLNKYQRREH
ncbi:MAG: hypothetical protein H6R26_1720, partial [Proteobacteria bacterium]|nr:hypothetical protein [Pseudomonadota bacterium]